MIKLNKIADSWAVRIYSRILLLFPVIIKHLAFSTVYFASTYTNIYIMWVYIVARIYGIWKRYGSFLACRFTAFSYAFMAFFFLHSEWNLLQRGTTYRRKFTVFYFNGMQKAIKIQNIFFAFSLVFAHIFSSIPHTRSVLCHFFKKILFLCVFSLAVHSLQRILNAFHRTLDIYIWFMCFGAFTKSSATKCMQ